MSARFPFNEEKALEVILYIAQRCSNMHRLLKVLYAADKAHLSEYGRQICGEYYVKMEHGPVHSGAYDLIKWARRDGTVRPDMVEPREAFEVEGRYEIRPMRAPKRDLLSESDMECLDQAIDECSTLGFGAVHDLSADQAWEEAQLNRPMSLESIVRTLPDGDLILDYITNA